MATSTMVSASKTPETLSFQKNTIAKVSPLRTRLPQVKLNFSVCLNILKKIFFRFCFRIYCSYIFNIYIYTIYVHILIIYICRYASYHEDLVDSSDHDKPFIIVIQLPHKNEKKNYFSYQRKHVIDPLSNNDYIDDSDELKVYQLNNQEI